MLAQHWHIAGPVPVQCRTHHRASTGVQYWPSTEMEIGPVPAQCWQSIVKSMAECWPSTGTLLAQYRTHHLASTGVQYWPSTKMEVGPVPARRWQSIVKSMAECNHKIYSLLQANPFYIYPTQTQPLQYTEMTEFWPVTANNY